MAPESNVQMKSVQKNPPLEFPGGSVGCGSWVVPAVAVVIAVAQVGSLASELQNAASEAKITTTTIIIIYLLSLFPPSIMGNCLFSVFNLRFWFVILVCIPQSPRSVIETLFPLSLVLWHLSRCSLCAVSRVPSVRSAALRLTFLCLFILPVPPLGVCVASCRLLLPVMLWWVACA